MYAISPSILPPYIQGRIVKKVALSLMDASKGKVFERSGGAADSKLLQKMDYYSTKG